MNSNTEFLNNYKISESLRLIRLNKQQTLDELAFKTGIDRRILSLLERGKLNLSLHYCEKLFGAYGFTTYISNQTIEQFESWKKETLLSMVKFDGNAITLFKNCPVDLYIVEHSPLYIDYKILYFILFEDKMSVQEIEKIKKSVFQKDRLSYFMFQLFYASYLNSTRKFEDAYKVFKKLKPINNQNLLAMYYYIGSFVSLRYSNEKESLDLVKNATQIFKELRYIKRYYFCMMTKGILLMRMQRYEESTKTYFETLDYFINNDLINVAYSTVCNIIWNYLLEGKYDQAWKSIKYFPKNCDKKSFYYLIQVICLYKNQNYEECLKYINLCSQYQDIESFNKRYSELIRSAIKYGENYRYEEQSITIFKKLLDKCEYTNARFVALQLYEYYAKRQDRKQTEKWYGIYKSDNIKVDGLNI